MEEKQLIQNFRSFFYELCILKNELHMKYKEIRDSKYLIHSSYKYLISDIFNKEYNDHIYKVKCEYKKKKKELVRLY